MRSNNKPKPTESMFSEKVCQGGQDFLLNGLKMQEDVLFQRGWYLNRTLRWLNQHKMSDLDEVWLSDYN